ncbi:ferrous-iron efflux pump FieF [Sulfurivirga caldicuralii]|uniref:Cation-efflux pump FieF n=1 Tax=Sulfurivirga caldicuralii TaxID=364032 RepID=A0A1N6GB20_9GAMM|nr:cation diffusion facilitator family transporter [Sulfurivirga caldicuralii]SIO04725.1 ferrous-iron efflux pump FieF [Sulfurivirga caldicuralii]
MTANNALLRRITLASFLTALLLVSVKAVVWYVTGSVSLLASLLDSGMDAIASLIILLAVRYALRPADEDHRFGHGKAEPLAALAQSVFILGSAIFFLLHALDRLLHPQPLQHDEWAIAVMWFSLAVTLVLVSFQRHVARKTGSTAVAADALHYASDIASNLVILAALYLAHFGWTQADVWLGLLVGLWIGYSALEVGRDALDQLLDKQLPEETLEQIRRIVLTHPRVWGFNDLRTFRSGPTLHIQLDLELDDHLPLVEAHRIAEEVTEALKQAFPQADVMIHQEPVSSRTDAAHHRWQGAQRGDG